MRFTDFLTSILLIVSVIFQSNTASPIQRPAPEPSCAEGSELVNGKCTKRLLEDQPALLLDGVDTSQPCPAGAERGKNGICRRKYYDQDQPADTAKPQATDEAPKPVHAAWNGSSDTMDETLVVLKEPLESADETAAVAHEGCPPGTKADESGACGDVTQTSSKKPALNPQSLLKEADESQTVRHARRRRTLLQGGRQ